MKIFPVSSALFFFLSLCTLAAQAQDPAKLDAFIQSSMTAFEMEALSIQVVKEGKVIFNKNYGTRSEASGLAPDEHTMYAIASLSKAFTAASIGMLVDEGKLKWSDKVVDHLSWFALSDPYVTANLTIEDLLCHRSGLQTFDGDLLWYGSTYSREEAIKRLSKRPLTHGFRESFGYQNLMFMTAGEVIEEASGMSWDEFVKTRILDPLEMRRTTSDFKTFTTDLNNARPTIKGEEVLMMSYDNCGATAALNSSTGDMGKWLQFWLNEGIVDGDTLLSLKSMKRILSLHTPLGTGSFDREHGTNLKGYGLGWFLMDYQGKMVAHHGGGLPGYISKTMMVPEDELGMIVLTNNMTSVPSMLMYAVMDWQAGKEITPWKETFLSFSSSSKESAKKKEKERMSEKVENPKMLARDAYIGTYEDTMYGQATVTMGEKGLRLTLVPSKTILSGDMEPFSDHAFKFNFYDPFLPFGVAHFEVEGSKVKSFTIDLPNGDFHFYKLDFQRVK